MPSAVELIQKHFSKARVDSTLNISVRFHGTGQPLFAIYHDKAARKLLGDMAQAEPPILLLPGVKQNFSPLVLSISREEAAVLARFNEQMELPAPDHPPSLHAALESLVFKVGQLDWDIKWHLFVTPYGFKISRIRKAPPETTLRRLDFKEILLSKPFTSFYELSKFGAGTGDIYAIVRGMTLRKKRLLNYYGLGLALPESQIPGDSPSAQYAHILNQVAGEIWADHIGLDELEPMGNLWDLEFGVPNIPPDFIPSTGGKPLFPLVAEGMEMSNLLLLTANEYRLIKLFIHNCGYVDALLAQEIWPLYTASALLKSVKTLNTKLALAFPGSDRKEYLTSLGIGYGSHAHSRMEHIARVAEGRWQALDLPGLYVDVWDIPRLIAAGEPLSYLPGNKKGSINSIAQINGQLAEINPNELAAIQALARDSHEFKLTYASLGEVIKSQPIDLRYVGAGYFTLCRKFGLVPNTVHVDGKRVYRVPTTES